MPALPAVVVFDVNETLSDLAPMADAFERVGAPAALARTWFASVLRDGFALAVVGESQPFADVARSVLRTVLASAGVDDVDRAADTVMEAFLSLPVHPDVPDGLRALRRTGTRLVTLTNGAVTGTEGLLGRAGVREEVERLMSVEQAGRWKPAPEAYAYAAQECGVAPGELLMVAVHPWDLHGAARAGLRTAWLDRSGTPWPAHLPAPELVATDLVDLARQLS